MRSSYIDLEKYRAMLGIYIREQREAHGLTLSACAKSIKMRPDHLKKIEAGEVLVRTQTLERLKMPLHLDEAHLEKIEDVAKIAFIDSLIQLMNPQAFEDDAKR